MGSSLALSYIIQLFVIELDYGYQYLLEVYSKLSSICFLSWLRYYSMLVLHDRPVLEMVSLLFLELYCWRSLSTHFILDNGMNLISKSLTVLTSA